MALASSDRFSPLLRWIGITLVVLTLLQMLAVLALWDWQAEPFRQLVVERLIKESPMALVGLLLMYLSGRLDDQNGWRRSPLLWTVCILSGLMAVLLTASLPIVFGGDQLMQEETDQQLAAKKGQLEMAREQSKNPEVLKQLLRQAEAAGQCLLAPQRPRNSSPPVLSSTDSCSRWKASSSRLSRRASWPSTNDASGRPSALSPSSWLSPCSV